MRLALPLLMLCAAPAWAEVPSVLAETAPVHSLVSIVMGDLGTPGMIVPPGTSPHDASLSPSEARALTEADLIVRTGDAFLPWVGEAIASLAPGTPVLALLETGGWEPLPLRDGAELAGEDEPAAEGSLDPHAWLDAAVAAAWLDPIAAALSEVDPANAGTYRRNAAQGAESLLALGAELRERLAPLSGTGFAVSHDAYQYMERAFGLPANWAVADATGQDSAPRDVAALRDAVLTGEVACLILDAETDPGWAGMLGEGTALRTATVDPDGVFLEPGPDLYPALLREMGAALESCLGG